LALEILLGKDETIDVSDVLTGAFHAHSIGELKLTREW
jgi:hypothetical protein